LLEYAQEIQGISFEDVASSMRFDEEMILCYVEATAFSEG
jgi:hypothetical protein